MNDEIQLDTLNESPEEVITHQDVLKHARVLYCQKEKALSREMSEILSL